MAGPFKIEGKAFTIAAKSKPVKTVSPVVAAADKPVETTTPVVSTADEPIATRNRPPVIIIGILCVMAIAAVALTILKKKATV